MRDGQDNIRVSGGGISVAIMGTHGGADLVTQNWSPPPTDRLAAIVIWRRDPGAALDRRPEPRFQRRGNMWMGGRGDDETRLDLEGGRIAVLGTEYALPEVGETLVVLVDRREEAGRRRVRWLVVPSVPIAPAEPTPSLRDVPRDQIGEIARRHSDRFVEAYREVLQSNPEIRAFAAAAGLIAE